MSYLCDANMDRVSAKMWYVVYNLNMRTAERRTFLHHFHHLIWYSPSILTSKVSAFSPRRHRTIVLHCKIFQLRVSPALKSEARKRVPIVIDGMVQRAPDIVAPHINCSFCKILRGDVEGRTPKLLYKVRYYSNSRTKVPKSQQDVSSRLWLRLCNVNNIEGTGFQSMTFKQGRKQETSISDEYICMESGARKLILIYITYLFAPCIRCSWQRSLPSFRATLTPQSFLISPLGSQIQYYEAIFSVAALLNIDVAWCMVHFLCKPV